MAMSPVTSFYASTVSMYSQLWSKICQNFRISFECIAITKGICFVHFTRRNDLVVYLY